MIKKTILLVALLILIPITAMAQKGNFDSASIKSIPEPTSMVLLGSGIVGLVALRRNRNK